MTKIGQSVKKLNKTFPHLTNNVANLRNELILRWKKTVQTAISIKQNKPKSPKLKHKKLKKPKQIRDIKPTKMTKFPQSQTPKFDNDPKNAPKKRSNLLELSFLEHSPKNNHSPHYIITGFESKKVPTLQQLCFDMIQRNPMMIIPFDLPQSLLLKMYKNCSVHDFKEACRINKHFIRKIDPLWETHLLRLDSNYKKQGNVSWFQAYKVCFLLRTRFTLMCVRKRFFLLFVRIV